MHWRQGFALKHGISQENICVGVFLNKVNTFRRKTLLKINSNTGVFV